MTDYISREAAYESLLNGMVMTGYQSRALDCISEFSIPAADVRPVRRGKWIDHQEGRWIYAKCSECGTVHDVKSNFCPSCGADMMEES